TVANRGDGACASTPSARHVRRVQPSPNARSALAPSIGSSRSGSATSGASNVSSSTKNGAAVLSVHGPSRGQGGAAVSAASPRRVATSSGKSCSPCASSSARGPTRRPSLPTVETANTRRPRAGAATFSHTAYTLEVDRKDGDVG